MPSPSRDVGLLRMAQPNNAFVVAIPLMLGGLELFHPHPHDLLILDLKRWMLIHYAQIALFPLVALSAIRLVRDMSGYAAALCRIGMFVFGIAYVAFDTAAGVVTGVLVSAAHATNAPEAWRAPVLAVWNHPIVGGSSEGAPALAVIGTIAWSVGTLSACVAVRRAGYSWVPTASLIISALGLLVFRTHAWPGGPVTFGALAVAAAAIVREGARTSKAALP
jgi:hypothetical protein